MDTRTIGLLILGLAAILAVIGLAVIAGLLNWFGRLPGDLRYESDSVRVYVPLASMLLLSIVVSVAVAVIARLR